MSESDLIQSIRERSEKYIASLTELDSKYTKYNQQIDQVLAQELADVDLRKSKDLETAKKVYDQKINQIMAELKQNEQKLSLVESKWEDPRWRIYSPKEAGPITSSVRIGEFSLTGPYSYLKMTALVPVMSNRNILFLASGSGKDNTRLAIQSIALRLLADIPPGKLRLICIDPIGLGSTVAGFIKELPETITGGQAWFEDSQIEQHLADIERHMAYVKQKYLGVTYPSMEEYNIHAGAIEEPYRLLIISDFPARFNDSAVQRVISIATNGPSTGVYLLGMVNLDREIPYNFNLSDLERTATVITCQDNLAKYKNPDFKDGVVYLDDAPSPELFTNIVTQISSMVIASSEIRIPFNSPPKEIWWKGDARSGIRVPVGVFGARETQYFEIDEKLLSSALIIGKTGSGKSTLLHVLINNLALLYSPDELELYLLDLQEVEFKDYALHNLPHARVVAINCEREFGLSVLQGLDVELHRRIDIFRRNGVTSLSEFRTQTKQNLPRILLFIDEFQELFIVDDTLATTAGMILDRIVRQGRKFGINILLASQTLAGPYSFSSATRNQIPIRIVLQCSDADSRLALSDENDRARLLERPGEAIYNSQNGRIEGNNRFQVNWLSEQMREDLLTSLHSYSANVIHALRSDQIIFEGNTLANIEKNVTMQNLIKDTFWHSSRRSFTVWFGDPLAIKPQISAEFRRQAGSNMILLAQTDFEEIAHTELVSIILSVAAQKSPDKIRFFIVDMGDEDVSSSHQFKLLSEKLPHQISIYNNRREAIGFIDSLMEEVEKRLNHNNISDQPDILFILVGMHRIRELRQQDVDFSRSYLTLETDQIIDRSPSEKIALIIRDGPELGVFTLLWCDTYNNLARVFSRQDFDEFDLRIAFQMDASDSRNFLDNEAASNLGPYRALFVDMERPDRGEKFRPYNLIDDLWLIKVCDMIHKKSGEK
jgi:S-DNA-T family DNA segregation ATPase FtsK/SpoIIIE